MRKTEAVPGMAKVDRACVAGSPLASCIAPLLLSLLFLTAPHARGQTHSNALPVLRTAQQIHTLSTSESDRQYPIHLAHAQITYAPTDMPMLFLRDNTGGVYADLGSIPSFRPHSGDIVSVDGISAPGKFTPVIIEAHLNLLGRAPLAPAQLTSFDQVLSGAVDSQWVAVRGIVRSVRAAWDSNVAITLASGPDRIDVITPGPLNAIPPDLVDAVVYVQAAAGASFNHRNQLVGTLLFMPDPSFLRIEEPARDPFTHPPRSVEEVMRPDRRGPGHRVHMRGVVTSTFGDRHFSLMDGEHGIFVTAENPTHLALGDLVDVAGFPSNGDYAAYLDMALTRRIGSAPLPQPVHLTAAQAFSSDHDAEPIEVEGLLLDRSLGENGITSLLLTDAGTSYLAVLSPDADRSVLRTLRIGSRLRLHGICVMHANADKTPLGFNILLRAPSDIVVLHRPSWWTTRHTLLVAFALWVLILVVVAWNLILRRQVRRHTVTIREQLREADTLRLLAEAAHQEKSNSLASVLSLQRELLDAQDQLRYQATHDPLTGLWNRRALLELLDKEMDRCSRTQASMGILMLDVDHFKPVNDSLGHLAGDQVLRQIALRITQATRAYDLSGRYGGEEFLVILPGCDREQTQAGAERIRNAIASVPVAIGRSSITLTVSIGATVAPEYASTETEILSLADRALYRAKSEGRNRTALCLSGEPAEIEAK